MDGFSPGSLKEIIDRVFTVFLKGHCDLRNVYLINLADALAFMASFSTPELSSFCQILRQLDSLMSHIASDVLLGNLSQYVGLGVRRAQNVV